MHCVEDHLWDIVHRFGGMGDLGEDEGECGHQTGNRNEMQTKSMHDPHKRAMLHAKSEQMLQNEDVKEYQRGIQEKAKRKRKIGQDDCKGE